MTTLKPCPKCGCPLIDTEYVRHGIMADSLRRRCEGCRYVWHDEPNEKRTATTHARNK